MFDRPLSTFALHLDLRVMPFVNAWPTGVEKDRRHKVDELLRAMDGAFHRAAVALHYYGRVRYEGPAPFNFSESDEARQQRRQAEDRAEHSPAVEARLAACRTEWAGMDFEPHWMNAQLDRKRSALGRMHLSAERGAAMHPWDRSYTKAATQIFVREFVFALDDVDNLLETLAELTETFDWTPPPKITQLTTVFPGLAHLRNSGHHIEDRVRMLGPNGKPIKVKPAKTAFADGAFVFYLPFNMEGDNVLATGADGNAHRLLVAGSTLDQARWLVQELVYSLDWYETP
jgi:hypothetical protein